MLIYLLILAFTIWMLIDAAKRGVEYYWFLIIIVFAPVGGIVYLVTVRMKALREAKRPQRALTARVVESSGPSLAELRTLALESPSIANRLSYGDALRQAKDYEHAIDEYKFVLQRDRKNREALHAAAMCHLELDQPAAAVEYLTRLMDIDPRYRDYQAAIDYAEALWLDGQQDFSLDVFEDLANNSTRLVHQLVFANYLALAERKTDARRVLEQALDNYRQSPPFVQRRDMQDARDAQQLLDQLC